MFNSSFLFFCVVFREHTDLSENRPFEFIPCGIPSKLDNAKPDVSDLRTLFYLSRTWLLRKEVIQPHLPIRLPCYDFTPVIAPTLDGCSLAVSPPASGVNDFRGVTGGVYKARERIHRSMLTCDY